MSQDFSGKVAFVTGGASGIGEAVVKQLAARGAKVVVADLKLDAAQATVDAVKAAGGEAAAVAVDVSKIDQVEKAVQFTVDTYGKLDVAVNNAGIGGKAAKAGDYSLDDWHKVIDVNLNSVFYSMKYEIAAMLKNGGGAIVNMASILGTNGFASAPAYVSAKHGVVGLTKAQPSITQRTAFALRRSVQASSRPRSSAPPRHRKRSTAFVPFTRLAVSASPTRLRP